MPQKSFLEAVATLVGTIIGAGILGLPFVVATSGAAPGVFLLVGLGLASLLLNLMFAEVVLRTRFRHQLAGYARKYLGPLAYRLETISFLIGGFGALTAYIIGEGEVLAALFGGDKFSYSLIFFGAGSFILLFGLRLVKVFELWMVIVFIVIIFVIFGMSFSSNSLDNWRQVDLRHVFSPYGVILFAYAGAVAIVPLREILRGREKLVKKAVAWASAIPIVLYVFFSLAVVGVTGLATTEVATIGLGAKIGPYMIIFGNLFAFFAMGTSFLTIGLTMKEYWQFDVKLKSIMAWAISVIVPLALFLFVANDFISLLGTVGGISVGLSGLMIVLMYSRAKKNGDREPEFSLPKFKFLRTLLAVIFVFGIVYTIIELVR